MAKTITKDTPPVKYHVQVYWTAGTPAGWTTVGMFSSNEEAELELAWMAQQGMYTSNEQRILRIDY